MKNLFVLFSLVLLFALPPQLLLGQECDFSVQVNGRLTNKICYNTSANLVITGNSNCPPRDFLDIFWYKGDNTFDTNLVGMEDSYQTDVLSANQIYRLVIDSSGTTLHDEPINIVVLNEMTASIIPDRGRPYCADETLKIEANTNSEELPLQYVWGNNSPLNTASREIVAGNYSVTITDAIGCSATTTFDFSTQPNPSIDEIEMLSICEGATRTIECSNDQNVSCRWILPNGNSRFTRDLIITNARDGNNDNGDNGTYIKIATLNDCVIRDTFTVEVGALDVSLDPVSRTACVEGESIFLDPSPFGGIYEVRDRNGAIVEGLINDDNEFDPDGATDGPYTIVYTYTDPDNENCFASTPAVVMQVNKEPDPMFSDDTPSKLCKNSGAIRLIDFVEPKDGVFFINNTMIDNDIFDTDLLDVGVYNIKYQVGDNGCVGDAFRTIRIEPELKVATAPDIEVCTGKDGISLNVNITGGFGEGTPMYLWDNVSDLNNETIKNPTIENSDNLPAGTNINFTVTVTNGIGCVQEASQMVSVVSQPSIEQITHAPICEKETTTIDVDLEGGVGVPLFKWKWEGRAQEERSNVFNTIPIDSSLMYDLTIEYPSNTGCREIVGIYNVVALRTPTPELVLLPELFGNNVTVCKDQPLIFLAKDRRDPESFYQWRSQFTDENDEIDETTPIYQIPQEKLEAYVGAPSFTVMVTEFLTDENGCNGSSSILVNIDRSLQAEKPAAIYYSPINNVLYYNDADACAYQWGYVDEATGNLVALDGQIYQSYVAEDSYDEDRVWWCQAFYEDEVGACGEASNGCSNIAVHTRSNSEQYDEQTPNAPKFVLYPNPTTNQVRLEADQLIPNTRYDIRITNALGQLLQTLEVHTIEDELEQQIRLDNYAAGIYYMVLSHREQIVKVQPIAIQP